jgi:hypothetical protein
VYGGGGGIGSSVIVRGQTVRNIMMVAQKDGARRNFSGGKELLGAVISAGRQTADDDLQHVETPSSAAGDHLKPGQLSDRSM